MPPTLFQITRAAWRRIGSTMNTMQARRSADIGRSVLSYEAEVISCRERDVIRVGDNCHIRGELLVFPHGGRIHIGNWVYIGPGSSLWSSSDSGIVIGDRVLISSNVHIHDTDGHPVDPDQRFAQTRAILSTGHPHDIATIAARPVRIGDDVWIGLNAVILKGVTIGKGAIVGAGSVVTRDVPEHCTVVGNPAQIVKSRAAPAAPFPVMPNEGD